MKIKPIALGNALAVVAFAAFIICMIWLGIDKSSYVSFWESWAHGFSLDVLVKDNVNLVSTKSIYGVVSFTASSWLVGYSTAWIYNKLSKEK